PSGLWLFFFFQAEDGIRDFHVTGVQTCALPISTLAREYKPLGKVQENLALQTEFARKMFDIAVKGAQDSASTARQSTSDAVKIKIGRASCRERVWIPPGAASRKKNKRRNTTHDP